MLVMCSMAFPEVLSSATVSQVTSALGSYYRKCCVIRNNDITSEIVLSDFP